MASNYPSDPRNAAPVGNPSTPQRNAEGSYAAQPALSFSGNGGGGSVGGGSLSGMTRRTDKAKKLTKMGFGVDQAGNMNAAYSPGSSAGSSRSPSKARFGGIKSLVRGLKGKQ